MSDLTARAIADLKAELAEFGANANRVTESMGSEIMRLQGELEQQRTRAEAAEHELRAVEQREAEGVRLFDQIVAELRAKLATRNDSAVGQRALAIAAIEDAQKQQARAETAERELREALAAVAEACGAVHVGDYVSAPGTLDEIVGKIKRDYEAAEANLAAVTRHRDDLLAFIKRDCEIMAATGVKESLLRDAIPVLSQQRDEARAKLAAIRAHLAGVDVDDMLHAERSRPTLSRIAQEGSVHARDHLARMDLAKINKRLVDYAPALLNAAREALEP